MKKKGIGFRIIVMAVIISAISAVIGTVGLYTTRKVAGLVDTMYNKSVRRVKYVQDIEIAILTGRSVLLDANTTGRTKEQTEAAKKKFQDEFIVFNEAVANYESTNIVLAERKALLQTVKEAGKEYGEKGLGIFPYIENGDFTGADKYMNSVIVPVRTEKLEPAVNKLISGQIDQAKSDYELSKQVTSMSIVIIIMTIIVGLIVSLTLGITITRSITKPVTKIVNSLSDSSSQIGVSSTQLSAASQEIANGAQEQASSIEETTSSMEELSSMVRQNLGNTRQASLLSEKATEASQNGFDKMSSMLSAMGNISKSTEDIRNVIDVIDDIAFQTNMLALNAAVEAARAGEAGMGFAVVADEVKNLANRSSESAKETATMIKETLKNVEDGMTISKDLSEIFKDILTNSKKVLEMNREVETASGQQDEGINQVNKAMIQFDTVVQTNASSAEETAGAAEELQSQVTSLNQVVDNLFLIVSGKSYKNTSQISSVQQPKARTVRPAASSGQALVQHSAAAGVRRQADDGGKQAAPVSSVKKEQSAPTGVHTISFENDDDFKPV